MQHNTLLLDNGVPYISIEAALLASQYLSGETGKRYQTTPYQGGYALVISRDKQISEQESDVPALYIRPSYRSQITTLLSALILIIIAFVFVEELLVMAKINNLFHWLHNHFGWHLNWGLLLMSIQGLLVLLSAYFVLKALLVKYMQRYFIGPKGIEARLGIISIAETRIEYIHIRGVILKQSIIERLLGYGSIEVATSGTDGSEIKFTDIADPSQIQNILKTRLKSMSN